MLAELLSNSIEKQAKPAVVFKPKRCLRSRLNSNACDLCLSLCPKKALALSGRKIVFTAELCTGCMACVSGCPNDAFASGFDLASLLPVLHGREIDAPVVLSCGRPRRHVNQITIPCIGLFSEPALAAFNAVAVREFYLDVQRCADCGNGHVRDLLQKRLQGIIKKNGRATDLNIRCLSGKNLEDTAPGRQRRFFLHMAKNSLVGLGRDAASVFVPSGKTEEREREVEKGAAMTPRLLQQAFDLLPADAVQKKELLLAYFYALKANENCDLCPSCTGMCPSGALKRRTGKEGKQLIFISAKCSGCGLCVAFCKKKGLTLLPGAKNAPGAALAIA